MKKILAVGLLGVAVSGCDKIDSFGGGVKSTVDLPKFEVILDPNLSSPDNALKTWWRYLDSKFETQNQICLNIVQKIQVNDRYSDIGTGEVIESLKENKITCPKTVYSREITEIKVETETRAIALAHIKNNTPSTVAPSSKELEWRAQGERYKYVIEKVGAEWRIAQAYTYSSYKNEWVPQYTKSEESFPSFVIHPQ